MKWMVLILFGGIGLGALIGGLIWGAKRYEIFRNGLRTQGKVVENYLSVSSSSDSSGGSSRSSRAYYPVVEFQTQRGETIRFSGSTGSSVPDFEIGTPVEVIYNPIAPRDAQIAVFSQMWLGPVVIAVAGFIFFAIGVGSFFLIADSDQSSKSIQRHFLSMRSDSLKINGTIVGVQEKDRGQYVFVCRAMRPGGTMEEEFETDFFTFYPGDEFVGKSITICLDHYNPDNYSIEFGPLLKEIIKNQNQ